MSQKKMEAYKEAKKNVKKLRKKEKRDKVLKTIGVLLIAAILIAGSVFLIYYTNVIKPEQEKAATQAALDSADATTDGTNIVDAVNSAVQTTDADGAATGGETTVDAADADAATPNVDVDTSTGDDAGEDAE